MIQNNNNNKYLRSYFILMNLWETGCRPNEITGLKKSDINFDKDTVKVFQTKTKKYKTVYLNDEILKILKDRDDSFLFIAHNKSRTYYSRMFKELRDELELNKEYCLYAFRHSFGTRILNKTKDKVPFRVYPSCLKITRS
ncbi:MAG: tyrosine-type recombinase/integrase [Brevinema sp.]